MKAIKKIIALGLGATMVGATMFGASAAASLSQYPAPFIKDGKFTGTLVVGDNAAAQDVVGVSDIAASLQYAASKKAGTASGASTVSVEGDAYQFEKGSDRLGFFEPISGTSSDAIRQTLTKDDLKALADGTFKGKSTETYSQKIDGPLNATVVWETYSDANDDPAIYLKFPAGQQINYKLSFNAGVASDITASTGRLEDFENNKISILGKEYTVTKAENTTSNLMKLTLMSGAYQDTLEVGQTKTYTLNGKDYEVKVVVVSGDSSTTALTKLQVNDEVTKSLAKDDTYTLKDGTDIGIKDILPTKSGDVVQNLVEFYLGAQKIVLDAEDNTIDIGENSNLDGANATITRLSSSTEKKITGIGINLTTTTAIYASEGSTFSAGLKLEDETDPVTLLDKLGIDIKFAAKKKGNSEVAKITRENDNSLRLTFTNKNGQEYKVPIFYINSSNFVLLGKEAGKDLFNVDGQTASRDDMFIVDSGDSDATSRVLQVISVKNATDSHYVKIKEVGTGDTTQYDWTSATNPTVTIDLDGTSYTITAVAGTTNDSVVLTDISKETDGASYLWTKYGSKFNLTNNFNETNGSITDIGVTYNLQFFEDKEKQEDNTSRIDSFRWTMGWDSAKSVADFNGTIDPVDGEAALGVLQMLTLDSDSKKSAGYSKWGTFFERDTNGDQDEWKITIPENQQAFDVFLTAGTATITSSEGATGEAVVVNKIDVGATKLASEVAGLEKTRNLILVGGPCANAAVEKASDKFPTCKDWPYAAGEAVIQLVEQADGSVALLVAGTNAADTRAATTIVAEATKLKAATSNKQKVTVATGALSAIADVVPAAAPAATTP
jgi:hypothetical protein